MARYKAKPRFSAGALVMVSKKIQKRENDFKYMIPSGDSIPEGNWYPAHKLSGERIAGVMPPGVPFMLIDDPEYMSFKIKVLAKVKKDKPKRVWKTVPERRWKIRILHEQRIYHMYLTKRQHDAFLVKAVLRRMMKEYNEAHP